MLPNMLPILNVTAMNKGGGVEINLTCPTITPTLGSELVMNGNMETGDPPSNWTASRSTLDGVADERTGGTGIQSLSITNTDTFGKGTQNLTHLNNIWFLSDSWAKCIGAGSDATIRFVGTSPLISKLITSGTSWARLIFTGRMTAANTVLWLINNTVNLIENRYDDVSVKPITFSSMIELLGTRSQQNGTYTCHPTVTTLTQCGLIVEYKDDNNFVMAIVDRYTDTAKLISVIGGTWTIEKEGAITYGAATELKVVVNGTTHQLFYDSVQISTDATIDNSGMDKSVYGFNSFSGNEVGVVTTNPL